MSITATQIASWANEKKAHADLPRLVRRLCFDAGSTRQIAFPAGDSTYTPGWDGTLFSEQGNAWVPAGASCWEMGCDKEITSKANGDYQKRTEQTTEAERLTKTFVFVTPRRWSTKSTWLADAARDAAGTAWSILHGCARQPGTQADGTIDHDAFKQFIKDARELCRQADRLDVCDQTIGQILAHAPADEDGTWPFALAREILEPLEMEEMRRGFFSGARNKRGVTSRGMWDGGGQERDLAGHYQSHAEKLHLTQPNVANLLDGIARSYERDGKDEDIEANLRKEEY